jgi:hypothetical protein
MSAAIHSARFFDFAMRDTRVLIALRHLTGFPQHVGANDNPWHPLGPGRA